MTYIHTPLHKDCPHCGTMAYLEFIMHNDLIYRCPKCDKHLEVTNDTRITCVDSH